MVPGLLDWSCQQYSGTTKQPPTVIDAIEGMCYQAVISTARRNVRTITKSNGKTGMGDLVLKNVELECQNLLTIYE